MSTSPFSRDDTADQHVDAEIAACLSLEKPKSFFLFAGAGSGKTGSLVKALQHVRQHLSGQLRTRGQRVCVITYTNAACEEIQRRVRFDPLIDVSTIHSFAWSLIQGLTRDTKHWLEKRLQGKLAELVEKEAKGRQNSAASERRKVQIASTRERLENLSSVKSFSYSPTGENRGRDALNHAEVLQLTAYLLTNKSAMQSILAGRYPILLIDESQDTMRGLVEALLRVEGNQSGRFLIGLIGDMMQRIYADGKEDLGRELPERWARPSKLMNHRCPKRVVELLNKVRAAVDDHRQRARSDAEEGVVRLYVLPAAIVEKPEVEQALAQDMATQTNDGDWVNPDGVKTLTLEHRMAAKRMGFDDAFAPLYGVRSWSTPLLEGKLAAVQFCTNQLLPILRAKRASDRFELARLVEKYSPMMRPEVLREASNGRAHLRGVDESIATLLGLWEGNPELTLQEALAESVRSGLLEPPDRLRAVAGMSDPCAVLDDPVDPPSTRDVAVSEFVKAPLRQVELMATYLSGRDRFGTHQGVKGLEFDRVMVVMDDSEAGGFSFSYEELFGQGSAEKRVAATRRLFYVTASRARKSLALVAYAKDPSAVRRFVLEQDWFSPAEVSLEVPATG